MTRVPRPADHIAARARGLAAPATHVAGPPGGRGTVESLYPFLYSDPADPGADAGAVLAHAATSTQAKAREIVELRDQVCKQASALLVTCARAAAARFVAGGRLLAFGNGGSATDAQQLVTLFLYPGPDARPLPAIVLASDVAVVTSLAHDVGIDMIFARQIAALGRPGDIAVGLSTSGNSQNLLWAFDEASHRGLMTIGIAGYDGGQMAELDSIDYLLVAPSASSHRIQEAQTTIYHILWELVMAELGDRRW